MTVSTRIEEFDFSPGRLLSQGKYEIVTKIGEGWESEVYMIRERQTGIERAAKFFFPHRNKDQKNSTVFAKKLHKLRECDVLVKYLSQGDLQFKKTPITFMISDLVEGVSFNEFIRVQAGKRLHIFEALHLLLALSKGVAQIHSVKEYHGDLHGDNILIQRKGLSFSVRILDPFHWKCSLSEMVAEDVFNLIKLFYESIGGARFYSKQQPEVKYICCGLKRSVIRERFRTASHIVKHLESIEWDSLRL